MVSTFSSDTLASVYKDDYKDSNNYNRILFNSGKALQARELTQMQTILQKQIERIGNNIFKEGAVVKPGGFSVNNGYEFVKLNEASNTLAAAGDVVGKILTGSSSSISAKVIQQIASESGDPATLFVHYTNTASVTNATTSNDLRFTPGENITDGGSVTLTVQTTNTDINPAIGVGTRISVGEGIYYCKGHFVFTENQSKVVDKYQDTYSGQVGFRIDEQVVTPSDDNTLYDNQGASPNISAPGADRYRIRLVLAKDSDLTGSQNFIHLADLTRGTISSKQNEFDPYAIPNDVLARRIKENSGNYIVKPFKIHYDADSESSHLLLKISDGIVVVDGYRAAHTATQIRVKKPIITASSPDEVVPVSYGNYVKVDYMGPSPDSVDAGNTKGIPDINTFELMNIRDDSSYNGNTIGTCNIRGITEDGSMLKYHLMDIRMDIGKTFNQARSIGTSGTNYFNPLKEGGVTVLYEPTNNSLLFKLGRARPSAVTLKSMTVQERYSFTSTGGGGYALNASPAGTFENTGDWILAKVDSDATTITSPYSVTLSGSTPANSIATFSGLEPSANYEVLTYMKRTSTGAGGLAGIRGKTITQGGVIRTVEQDARGQWFLNLKKADIHELQEVWSAGDSASGSKITSFRLDNGQRDGYYGYGRLLLKSGVTSLRDTLVHAKFKYFEHDVSGDCFAWNSYNGQVEYADVPSHTLANGKTIPLRNYLDFRSIKDSAYAGSFAAGTVNKLPQPTDTIVTDVDYYLPEAQKLTIDTEGEIYLHKGDQGFRPTTPETPLNHMGLYRMWMHPNTLNDSDVTIVKIDAQRYTMAGINKLEKRIDKLEEVVSLSLLELDTKSFQVFDSSGLDRTKSGFFVDNFRDHTLSQTGDEKHTASIDPRAGLLLPAFRENNIRLIYDSAASPYTVKRGDIIYPLYEDIEYLDASEVTSFQTINPFDIVVHQGNLTLSPSSDEWRETTWAAARAIDGGTKLSTDQALNWNSNTWNWGGADLDDLNVGSKTNVITTDTSTQITTEVNSVTSSETITEVVGTRIIGTSLIPFMRAREVSWEVNGMRPNSRLFAYFDGQSIASWVKQTSFTYYSDTSKDWGNTGNLLQGHPDTASTLTSNGDGYASGSFFLPAGTFRTGTKEMVILDVSALNYNEALSIAAAPYTATGYLDTYQEDIKSTRILTVTGSSSTEKKHIPRDDRDPGSHWEPTYIKTIAPTGEVLSPPIQSNNFISYADCMAIGYNNGDGNDGDGTAGDSWICGAAYANGFTTDYIARTNRRYGIWLRRTDPTLMKGYDVVGKWISEYIRDNKNSYWVKKLSQILVDFWAKDFKNELTFKDQLKKFFFMYPVRFSVRSLGWILKRIGR